MPRDRDPWYEVHVTAASGWGALERAISGEVVLTDSPDYDRAYRSLNARFDAVRPQAVVRCRSQEDVVEAIRYAQQHRIAVATRSGGHCFGGRSSTEGLLVDVTTMRSVDVSGGGVTVGGGARLGDVYDALLDRGLTIPGGSCPSVGVAGLALGGGLGIIGRRYGLTSDHLLGAQVVLADGRIVECDRDHEEDLFWALRGGGAGNFGVVTFLTFRTIPAPDATNFHLTWPFSEARSLIDAWQTWAPVAPDGLAASLVIEASAQVEEPPSVELFGVMLGTESDTEELVEQLVNRAGPDPATTFREHMSFRETIRHWGARATRDPIERPGQELRGYRCIKSEFFRRSISAEVIARLLETFLAGRVAGQSRELDFSPWGGGYGRMSPEATAFFHRDDRYWLKHAGEVDPGAPGAEKKAAHDWVTRSWSVVHPFGTGRVFPNFPDPDLEDWARAYFGRNLDRLVRVKARYDPENLFLFHQSLPNA
jgi:FAD/FMN-containing dehydrogenase